MSLPNWQDKTSRVTPNFSVKECCWLPSWGVMHQPDSHEQANLVAVCELLEKVRDVLNRPLNIHCMIRPRSVTAPGTIHNGQDYNSAVGGARQSAHIVGLAVDFDAGGDCDTTRSILLPYLEQWGARMERKDGAGWVHMDLAPVTNNRYFTP